MTCVVATRKEVFGSDRPKITLAADSAGSNGQTILSYEQPKKVFKVGDFLIGYTTSFRMGQILHFCGLETLHAAPEEDSYTFLVTKVIPHIREAFKREGFSTIENNVEDGGQFIIVYDNEIFVVHRDFHVSTPTEPYAAIGSGAEIALGCLYAQRNSELELLDPIGALEAAEHFCAGVRAPFISMWYDDNESDVSRHNREELFRD